MLKIFLISIFLLPSLAYSRIGKEDCFKLLKKYPRLKAIKLCQNAGDNFSMCMGYARKNLSFDKSVNLCLKSGDEFKTCIDFAKRTIPDPLERIKICSRDNTGTPKGLLACFEGAFKLLGPKQGLKTCLNAGDGYLRCQSILKGKLKPKDSLFICAKAGDEFNVCYKEFAKIDSSTYWIRACVGADKGFKDCYLKAKETNVTTTSFSRCFGIAPGFSSCLNFVGNKYKSRSKTINYCRNAEAGFPYCLKKALMVYNKNKAADMCRNVPLGFKFCFNKMLKGKAPAKEALSFCLTTKDD